MTGSVYFKDYIALVLQKVGVEKTRRSIGAKATDCPFHLRWDGAVCGCPVCCASPGRGCLHHPVSSQLLEKSPFHIVDIFISNKLLFSLCTLSFVLNINSFCSGWFFQYSVQHNQVTIAFQTAEGCSEANQLRTVVRGRRLRPREGGVQGPQVWWPLQAVPFPVVCAHWE